MSEEQALFDTLQDYTFSVIANCLLEAEAFNLVRHYLGQLLDPKKVMPNCCIRTCLFYSNKVLLLKPTV